ncbi:MAG: hypothetical protein H6626_02790 [Pseudobdellovibrionaceae bacterium]|nr:MAG: hypothetical protein H6626_02790 [Pseudobdellovibrionaceae bacterium]
MKKKIIFVVTGLVLVLAGIMSLNQENQMKTTSDTLRVAFPYNRKVTDYEPTQIHLAPEYIFLENTFSPLIDLSKDKGDPISAVAKSFQWVGDELHFEIRDDLFTIDGIKITAKDAEFSLKRLLVLSENTHGNFKDLICSGKKLESIDEPCSGIEVRGNTLVLKPGEQKPFLLKMVAAIDFAIIPIGSVDKNTLKITDYRNTSGLYYVESDDGHGNVALAVNSKHFHYDKSVPQKIELVPSGIDGAANSLSLFQEGKVDFVTTIDKLNPEKVIQFSEQESDTELHSTMNIRTFVAVYTPKAISRLSQEKRLMVGKSLKKVFRDYYKNTSGYEPTDQFFPPYGDGGLTKENRTKLEDTFKNIEEATDGTGLHLSIVRFGNASEYIPLIEKALRGIKITEDNNIPAFIQYKNESEIPDIYLGGPDTGFMEDIGLISYSMNAGIFGYKKSEAQAWLKDYMQILDKEERLKRLRELHYQVLSSPALIPLVSAPYVALARKPWKIELSQIYANNPLWLVKKN